MYFTIVQYGFVLGLFFTALSTMQNLQEEKVGEQVCHFALCCLTLPADAQILPHWQDSCFGCPAFVSSPLTRFHATVSSYMWDYLQYYHTYTINNLSVLNFLNMMFIMITSIWHQFGTTWVWINQAISTLIQIKLFLYILAIRMR